MEVAALQLEGEARDWWFSQMSHIKMSTYADFTLRLKNRYGRKKPKTYHIATYPIIEDIVHEQPKEHFLIISQEEEPLKPPPAVDALTSRGGSLASFQYGLEFLTFGAPCMIHEMHEEETYTSTSTLVEEKPSSLLAVGETITPVGGTLVDVQDVPEIQLVQGLHILSYHIISVPHI